MVLLTQFYSGYLTACFDLFGTVYDKDNFCVVCFSTQHTGEFFDSIKRVLTRFSIHHRISQDGKRINVERVAEVRALMDRIAKLDLTTRKQLVYDRYTANVDRRREANPLESLVS